MTEVSEKSSTQRYTPVARWFHWITVVLTFAVIPLGWIFGAFKTKPGHPDTFVAPFPGSPADYASAHMSVGLIIFLVVAARIMYRALNQPPFSDHGAIWERRLSRITHLLLYTVLIIMPTSGYIMSAGDKPPIVFMGLFKIPKAPISEGIGYAAAIIHVLVTQFVVYALILLHLGAVAWHLFIRRDGILSRMLPRQRNEL